MPPCRRVRGATTEGTVGTIDAEDPGSEAEVDAAVEPARSGTNTAVELGESIPEASAACGTEIGAERRGSMRATEEAGPPSSSMDGARLWSSVHWARQAVGDRPLAIGCVQGLHRCRRHLGTVMHHIR
jgi:hypothetical protein